MAGARSTLVRCIRPVWVSHCHAMRAPNPAFVRYRVDRQIVTMAMASVASCCCPNAGSVVLIQDVECLSQTLVRFHFIVLAARMSAKPIDASWTSHATKPVRKFQTVPREPGGEFRCRTEESTLRYVLFVQDLIVPNLASYFSTALASCSDSFFAAAGCITSRLTLVSSPGIPP